MVYTLELAAVKCKCSVIVNGLGVAQLNAEKTGSIQYPCNTELVGERNSIYIEITPASLDMTELLKVKVEGTVSKYHPNEVTGPEVGDVLVEFSLEEKLAALRADPFSANIQELIPFKLSGEFDSDDAPSFRSRLIDADVIVDKTVLFDWAIKFRDALKRQDISALYALYEPKLIDYDSAFPEQKEPNNADWFANWMKNKIFPQTPFCDFENEDIKLVKWCDGRIWEILLKDGNPLWRTLGLKGRRSKVQVYVGLVDGEIKIVR